jgi:hypothetical protein
MMFATFTIATISWAADNTIGTWKLNAAKSKPAPGISPLTSGTQTIEAIDGGVRVTTKGERADGSKLDVVSTVKYDGKPAPATGTGLAYDTVAARQVDANTVTEERTKQGAKYHMSARRVVSPDGKTMTITAKGTGADGKPATNTVVWDKQ